MPYQPLRARSARAESPALKAAQRGRSGLVSPGDIRKAAMKKRNRKRYRGRARNSTPLERIFKMRRSVN